MIEFTYDYKENLDEYPSKMNYIINPDAMWCVTKTSFGGFCSKVEALSSKFMFAPTVTKAKPWLWWNIPKVPREMVKQIHAFFDYFTFDVADGVKNEDESMIQVYWDKIDKVFKIFVPEQVVKKASIFYDKQKNLCVTDSSRYALIIDHHSHNTMFAGFSGIDDGDEVDPRLFMVSGEFGQPKAKIVCRTILGQDELKEQVNFDCTEFYEIEEGDLSTSIGAVPGVDFPKEWLDNVHRDLSKASDHLKKLYEEKNPRAVSRAPYSGRYSGHHNHGSALSGRGGRSSFMSWDWNKGKFPGENYLPEDPFDYDENPNFSEMDDHRYYRETTCEEQENFQIAIEEFFEVNMHSTPDELAKAIITSVMELQIVPDEVALSLYQHAANAMAEVIKKTAEEMEGEYEDKNQTPPKKFKRYVKFTKMLVKSTKNMMEQVRLQEGYEDIPSRVNVGENLLKAFKA